MANSVIRSISIMLIGFLLIFWSDSVVGVLIRVMGAAFFLPALVSLVNVCVARSQGGAFSKILISIIDVGSMAFGLWLMIAPSGFETLFVKLIAVLLLLFAVYQIVMMVLAQKRCSVSAWMYIVPLLLVVASIMLFTSSFRPLEALSVIFGVVAVASGISDLIISLKLRKNVKSSGSDIIKQD